MSHSVIRRDEMLGATLKLGGAPIPLDHYATMGLLGVVVAPRGVGKSNAALLIAQQLSIQGWVSVIIDPEGEMESLYGKCVADKAALGERLRLRDQPIVVVNARNATEFLPYGRVILDCTDQVRKPIFVVIDEGQLFSASRKRGEDIGEAADIINEFAGRGRKRALDMFITALRYTGTLHRTLFANKNLTLICCQEYPTCWSALAPQFKGSNIEFNDLNALAPGEFFGFSRRGVAKVKMPMAAALQKVAPRAKAIKRPLPTTFAQWTRALTDIPDERLGALTDPVIELLGTISGLTSEQMAAGASALFGEIESRA